MSTMSVTKPLVPFKNVPSLGEDEPVHEQVEPLLCHVLFHGPWSKIGGENDDDELVFDLAWPHLLLVYELLLKFITSSCLDAKVVKLDRGRQSDDGMEEAT
ncbi:Serine/threonine protein phosphatase 2A 57 kDa regulatory subunit B' iota isoform [Spatholobus suberectus]|nr:Serine/threonine protein phosphatase 2A 57 kDa regulatory subunit B' iota isoform [Spatholobus suberectus]